DVTVTVDDGHPGGRVSAVTNSLRILDQPLVLSPAAPAVYENAPFQGTLATFFDPGGDGTTDGYKVRVDWGDGTVNDNGDGTGAVTVTAVDRTHFAVVGGHFYPGDEGAVYRPTVQVSDDGGAQADGPLTWQPGPAAQVSRQGAVAVRGADGLIYVVGGS